MCFFDDCCNQASSAEKFLDTRFPCEVIDQMVNKVDQYKSGVFCTHPLNAGFSAKRKHRVDVSDGYHQIPNTDNR